MQVKISQDENTGQLVANSVRTAPENVGVAYLACWKPGQVPAVMNDTAEHVNVLAIIGCGDDLN